MVAFPSHFCNSHIPLEIILFILEHIITIFLLILCIFSIYYVINFHLKQNPFPKSMLISQLLFYISSIIFSISWSMNHYGLCFYIESLQDLTEILSSLCLGINLLTFILILFCRLFYAFDETPFSISRKNTIIFIIFTVIISLIGFILIIYYLIIQRNLIAIFIIFGIYLFIFTVLSQCLAFIFIYKLYKLHLQSIIDGRDSNKIIARRSTTNSSMHIDDRTNNQNNSDLIKTMTKYSILSIIAAIGITLTMIISFLRIISEQHTILRQLFALTIFIGPTIDTICVSLSFKFSEKYYDKFCNNLSACFGTKIATMAENHAFKIQSDHHHDTTTMNQY